MGGYNSFDVALETHPGYNDVCSTNYCSADKLQTLKLLPYDKPVKKVSERYEQVHDELD